MKKILTILLATLMVVSLFAFVGCGNDAEATLKLGLGLSVSGSATDATAEAAGNDQLTVTAAAVLVDDAGKIVKAFIDCADSKVGHTADGKAVVTESFKTKYELGANYGMTNPAYGGTATKEWFEQADAFCALIVGKTAAEVKALVAEDAKGTADVQAAGCTIYVSDFAKAVEKAVANAIASNATANDTLKLGVATSQTATDATAEAKGSNKLETYLFAAAVNAEGKIVAASSDCVEATFGFDATGKTTFDASAQILSKKEKGDNYGMTNPAYGGTATLEWYQQAAAFDAACLGKTASEVAGLMGADYKGTADVQAAGCTIYVSGFVKAAAKIG